jgi:hypothetical protein
MSQVRRPLHRHAAHAVDAVSVYRYTERFNAERCG